MFRMTHESAVQVVVGSIEVEYSNHDGEAQSTSTFLPMDEAASRRRWAMSYKRR